MGTYGLRVPASRVGYVPEAQGGLLPGPRVLYVLGTRTSHGRTVRTAYRRIPGDREVEALAHAAQALQLQPEHPKALYRRAQAHTHNHDQSAVLSRRSSAAGACSDAMLGAWADQRCRELIEQMPWNAPQGDPAPFLTVRR